VVFPVFDEAPSCPEISLRLPSEVNYGMGVDEGADAILPPVRIDPSLLNAWSDVLENLPDAVFMIAGTGSTGRILYLNCQAASMFGYERGEIIDQPMQILVPTQARERHIALRRAYAGDPRLQHMGAGRELLGRRRDGTDFPIDVLLTANDRSTAPVTIAVVRDITAHRELEDALTRARDAAVRANEVKSRFLAAASHDLRQPLQTIWTMQAVLARAFENSDYAPHIALLEEAVRTMDQMLAALIDINRLEVGAIQPVIRDFPLQEILPRLRSEFGYAAASKSLTLDIEDSAEFARSDVMLLPVILRNLVGNAIKYTQHGMVRLHVRAQGSQLSIDITDTGPGIAPENLGRLFEAFYQVDNPNRDQSRGVGLGLSIVQTICRLLGHTVSIESGVGEGSTFTVQLHRGKASAVAAKPIEIPVLIKLPPAGAIKVLHIEDDPGVSRSMAMLLRLEGYEVTSVVTREEAMQQVDVHALRPDLILSDFQLPMGFRGDEIVAEIAARLGFKPPTIMLTGDIANKHTDKAKSVADRILPKPVDVNALLREIKDLLDTRH
jgi:PAS domain S-box-containing protein